MIKPFTYEGEPGEIRDNIALVQTLERCAAAYRNRCLNSLDGEHPNPMWVRLYVASERLRQAVCQNNVARTILDIGSDLMGCDDMAILELHGDSTLSLLAGSGMTAARQQALAANARAIADAIEAFKISIVNADMAYNQLWSQLGTTAFVPVWHENRPRGAIILYRLLPQGNDLDLADRELLRLLSMFSGPSLFMPELRFASFIP
jgi:GAF domain-containing protein